MADTRFEIKGVEKLKDRLDLANMSAKPIRNLMRQQGQIIRKTSTKRNTKI